MIRAYRLYTGSDGNSHVARGSVSGGELVEAESILFKETPAHSSFDWHNAPIPQYVITLAGVLEFTTLGGETFTIHPGDVLLALDHTGSGHKWRSINDEPWRRAYVVLQGRRGHSFHTGSHIKQLWAAPILQQPLERKEFEASQEVTLGPISKPDFGLPKRNPI